MAKYIVDIDSLIECCDFLSEGKLNGNDYAYVQNVKAFIQRFPKDEYIENVKVYREFSNDTIRDILEGKGLKSLED